MNPKISIAIPTHENVPVMFAYDLASLAAYTTAAMPEDTPFGISLVSGTYVHAARQELANAMVADRVSHVLWLDSDMRFPRDSLVRLLKHNLPMVGINYSKRDLGAGYTALKVAQPGDKGRQLVTNNESTGLETVDAIGFGCVLMKAGAFAGLPDPRETPWFQHQHLGNGDWMGEDVFFCKLLRESGVDIHVDHDLSRECSHIGQFEYQTAHAALFV